MIYSMDNRQYYGEERWIGIGWMHSILSVIVYVEIVDDLIRIISARKATKNERKYYEKRIEN